MLFYCYCWLQGDSGSPLIVKRSSIDARFVGVESYGVGCVKPNYYGVYIDVYTYLPWIRRILAVSIQNDARHCQQGSCVQKLYIN